MANTRIDCKDGSYDSIIHKHSTFCLSSISICSLYYYLFSVYLGWRLASFCYFPGEQASLLHSVHAHFLEDVKGKKNIKGVIFSVIFAQIEHISNGHLVNLRSCCIATGPTPVGSVSSSSYRILWTEPFGSLHHQHRLSPFFSFSNFPDCQVLIYPSIYSPPSVSLDGRFLSIVRTVRSWLPPDLLWTKRRLQRPPKTSLHYPQ